MKRLAELTQQLPSHDDEIENVFSTNPGLVSLIGLDGYFIRLNNAWVTSTGWTKEELRSRPFISFIHPDDADKTWKVWEEKSLHNMAIAGFVNRYECKDGTYISLLWNAPAATKKGSIYCLASDVTILVAHG